MTAITAGWLDDEVGHCAPLLPAGEVWVSSAVSEYTACNQPCWPVCRMAPSSATTRGVNRWRGVAANALAHAGSFSTPWVMSWSASLAARGVQSVSSITVSMGPIPRPVLRRWARQWV